MAYYVYILFTKGYDKYYIGQTNAVEERLKRHNSGTEKATAPYRPWEILWFTEKPSRAEAMELEKKLKNLSKRRLIAFMDKYRSV